LISVVLGAANENARAAESQKLLNWGFSAFDVVRLMSPGQPVATPPVWKGTTATVKLGQPRGVVVAVPAGEGARLSTRIERPDPLVAPLQQGQAVGTLLVTQANGTELARLPLVVLDTVPQAGVLGRAWDALRLWLK